MDTTRLPRRPGAEDFRALARSSPWRFTTLHVTAHRPVTDPDGSPAVEAWLDRSRSHLTVRTERGVEVATGVPYTTTTHVVSVDHQEPVHEDPAAASPDRAGEPVLRADGLVASRPEGWAFDHGDPMWHDYQWTAMLDPEELSHGVEIDEVTATTHLGRLTWSARCRPLLGRELDDGGWDDDGYDPRCGCCPLLDSLASRIPEYGADGAARMSEAEGKDPPTTYLVHLDVGTGVVIDITSLDEAGGGESVLAVRIHAVDEPLRPPTPTGVRSPRSRTAGRGHR